MKKRIVSLFLATVLICTLLPQAALFVSAEDAANSIKNALPISVNTDVSDLINDKYDVDFFKFTLSSAGMVSLTFSREYQGDNNEYWTAAIFNEDTNNITYCSFNGVDRESTTFEVGLSAGTYFVRVRGGNWYDGQSYSQKWSSDPYTLCVNYTKNFYIERELNETLTKATSIKVNNSYSGSIRSRNDVDYYNFSISNPGIIRFQFSRPYLADNNEYWTIALINEETNTLFSYSFNGVDRENATCEVGLASGTYYVRVRGGNWYDGQSYSQRWSSVTYTLEVAYSKTQYCENESSNDSASTATGIVTDHFYKGSTCRRNDEDFYTFSLDHEKVLSFQFQHEIVNNTEECWTAALFDEKLNTLGTYSISGTNDSVTTAQITLSPGKYYVRIRGGNWYDAQSYSQRWSNVTYRLKVRTPHLDAPVITLSNVASSGKIKVSWKAVDGATSYKVYRATSRTGSYTLMKTTTGLSYINTSAVAGKTYYYKVKAVDGALSSKYSAVKYRTCDLARPVVTGTHVASTGKNKLTWKAVDGAVKYKVYCATSKSGTYKLMKTTTARSYTNTGAAAGKTYYYRVMAVAANSAANSAKSSIKTLTCDLARPVVSITRTAAGHPKLSWKTISGAVKYKVYRAPSKNGTYKLMKTTTARSYTNTGATAGKTYYYRVMAVAANSAANSAKSAIVSITAK